MARRGGRCKGVWEGNGGTELGKGGVRANQCGPRWLNVALACIQSERPGI